MLVEENPSTWHGR